MGEKWGQNLPCPACNMRGCSYCGNTKRVNHIEYSNYGEIRRVARLVGIDNVAKAIQAEVEAKGHMKLLLTEFHTQVQFIGI